MRPGGAFLIYQFRSFAYNLIRPLFDRIDHGFAAWNVPPCHLYWGWKSLARKDYDTRA